MGTTTRVKGEMGEKKPFNFALFWDKYGTFFILAIIVAIFGTLSSEYFLTTNNITQIFVQSSVTVLIGMGEFFAILVAGIDLSVGAILALSGMVTAKLMLAGVDPFLAALIGWGPSTAAWSTGPACIRSLLPSAPTPSSAVLRW